MGETVVRSTTVSEYIEFHRSVGRSYSMTWFHRPYLHMYKSSKEVEEVGIISLRGMNIECDSNKETLLGVSILLLFFFFCRTDQIDDRIVIGSVCQRPFCFTLFTAANSHALAAPSLKELRSWTSKLDPTASLA